MNWKGVAPAITTPFNENLSIDQGFLAEHARWLLAQILEYHRREKKSAWWE